MRRLPLFAAVLLSAAVPAVPAAAQQGAPDPESGAPGQAGTPGATPTTPDPDVAPDGGEGAPLKLSRGRVKSLQRRLRVTADGAVGPRTRAAIRRLERREGLAVDGLPDALVLKAVGLKAPASRPAEEAAQDPAAAAPAGAAAAAVQAAGGQLGTPYRSAGDRPGGFDCSGLTMWSYGQAGVELPHSSFEQARLGEAVAKDAIQAGDLVFFSTAGAGASDVGIATGPDTVISATTKGVKEHAIFDEYWGGHYVTARRVAAG
jgi:cell wall-associated NlpC family hydrolase